MAINKIIPVRLDKSSDFKRIPPTSMVDALNMIVTEDDSLGISDNVGDLGVIKNVKGNTAMQYLSAEDEPAPGEAKIIGSVNVYPSAKIWDPKNLIMHNRSCIDNGVLIYNVDMVSIGERSVISSYAKLCTATHDYNVNTFDLKTKPINIMNDAWICMDAFVGPGIEIGSFGVVLARSVVLEDIPSYAIYVGNPAKLIRKL